MQRVVKKVEEMSRHFSITNIKTEYSINAEHGFPTLDYGQACWLLFPPFILDCKYDGAGEALSHIYGPLKPKGKYQVDNLMTLLQVQFTPGGIDPKSISMDTIAYAYVPKACHDNSTSCALLIALHGCLSGAYLIGLEAIQHIGYNEWAETSNIVVLYPQAISSISPLNPEGVKVSDKMIWSYWFEKS